MLVYWPNLFSHRTDFSHLTCVLIHSGCLTHFADKVSDRPGAVVVLLVPLPGLTLLVSEIGNRRRCWKAYPLHVITPANVLHCRQRPHEQQQQQPSVQHEPIKRRSNRPQQQPGQHQPQPTSFGGVAGNRNRSKSRAVSHGHGPSAQPKVIVNVPIDQW